MLLDDFSECTGEARKIEDAKLGRALRAKKEKEARGTLGALETPAQLKVYDMSSTGTAQASAQWFRSRALHSLARDT